MNGEPSEPDETILSDRERAALRRAIDGAGEGVFAVAASVHRATVGRALAALPTRRGSVVLIRAALARGGWLK